MARGQILLTGLDVLELLLDNRGRRLEDFSVLGLHEKTLRRILTTLELVPRFQVIKYYAQGVTFWRSDYRLRDQSRTPEYIRCAHCDVSKHSDEFSHNRCSPTKKQRNCKECQSDLQKEWRAKNKDLINARARRRFRLNKKKVLARDRKYRNERYAMDEEYREKRKQYARNYRSNNREKTSAASLVRQKRYRAKKKIAKELSLGT